ncbi:MAG: hypothetical protein UV53_C0011G0012 [Candidatus Azambacteria bacterium GW2011_GWE1_42_9]|nr:MAG: hypothetical protein UU33_C0001G0374 [Candidatus Azambacteria bacterium GW2011_GWF1_41_10]KKS49408.1 MAG: hypothetical protein UV14_C0001G0154 [Candidatus Azambacteria bacterium GW2011_GWF2_42_22]KKS69469.1 MAG: hypothetical protein UV39_C0010G0009 [Candidatus Azambacteria bacterium GW2011_GWA2_42_62]KKS74330.1 MAG: hypothetical protein UV45_C0007G0024 [Candidatus Azambacteria bacterium GW2011_GWB1_42_72]KKS79239.1 MAG: hypothetical protein UV53_C0011G0012 [Candidatus Azambacteria bacte
MAIKHHLPVVFVIAAGVAFGVFMFAPVSQTVYVKNSAFYRASAENKIGNLADTIIPSIAIPKNITENFAASLAQELISKNSTPKTDSSGQPALATPDVNVMAEKFIKDGLTRANENILNIKIPDLKISSDNSKSAIEKYLSESQTILNDNLKSDISLFSILEKINENNGAGLEKLLPVIDAYETAANQLEEKSVPSNLKDLMTEEPRLLRITANILKAITNVETDPLGAMAATKQFEAILQSWDDLQKKMDIFIKNFNKI